MSDHPNISCEDPDSQPTIASGELPVRLLSKLRIEIPGYDMIGEVARGGQAIVYKATQNSTGRIVAVKLLREGPLADEAARERLHREVRVLAALDHPGIVTVIDSGTTAEGHDYLVMNFIAGRSLDELVADTRTGKNRADPSSLLTLFIKICDAVNAAHMSGIIHRDLSPSNIRIDERGEPHVLDFGLARTAFDRFIAGSKTEISVSGQFLGKLAYASPEQARGSPKGIDIRTDVYALGVILYQILTGGRFPYEVIGNIVDVLNNIINARPTPPSKILEAEKISEDHLRRRIKKHHPPVVNETIEAIVLKALEKNPADRYQSAGELSRDVENYLCGAPTIARPVPSPRSASLRSISITLFPRSPRRAFLAAASVVLVVLIVMAAHQFKDWHKRRPSLEEITTAVILHPLRSSDAVSEVHSTSPVVPPNTSSFGQIRPATAGPMSSVALVSQPRLLPGLKSWNLDTIVPRGSVVGIAVDEGSRTLAVASGDGLIRFYDQTSGNFVRAWVNPVPGLRALAWSYSGSYIATGAEDGRVIVWNAKSGKALHVIPPRVADNSDTYVQMLAWSRDEQSLAIIRGSKKSVAVWNLNGGDQRTVGDGPHGTVSSISWSPDGLLALSFSVGGVEGFEMMRILDPVSGLTRATFTPSPPLPGRARLHWSSDGKTIVIATPGALIVWDVKSETVRRKLSVDVGSATVRLSPDGRKIAADRWKGDRVFDTDTGASMAPLEGRYFGETHQYMEWSPDGAFLYTGTANGDVFRWDSTTWKESWHIAGRQGFFQEFVAPTGALRFASVAQYDRTVRIWDAATGMIQQSWPLGFAPSQADCAGTSTRLAILDASRVPEIWVFDTAMKSQSGRERVLKFSLPDKDDSISTVQWSPKGTRVAIGANSGAVFVLDCDSPGPPLMVAKESTPNRVFSISWSPDESRLAVGRWKGLAVVDLKGNATSRLFTQEGSFNGAAWRRDGETILAGGGASKGSFYAISASTGARTAISLGAGTNVLTIQVNARNDAVAISTRQGLYLWPHPQHGSEACKIFDGPTQSVGWIADGQLLAADCNDRVAVFDAGTGQLVRSQIVLGNGYVTVYSDGSWSGSPLMEKELRVIAETDAGEQATMSRQEFSARYGWPAANQDTTLPIAQSSSATGSTNPADPDNGKLQELLVKLKKVRWNDGAADGEFTRLAARIQSRREWTRLAAQLRADWMNGEPTTAAKISNFFLAGHIISSSIMADERSQADETFAALLRIDSDLHLHPTYASRVAANDLWEYTRQDKSIPAADRPEVKWLLRALEISSQTLGDADPEVVWLRCNYARFLMLAGDVNGAEKYWRERYNAQKIAGANLRNAREARDELVAILLLAGNPAEAEKVVSDTPASIASADWEGDRRVPSPPPERIEQLRQLLLYTRSCHKSGTYGNRDFIAMDVGTECGWDPRTASGPDIETMRESAAYVYHTRNDGLGQPAQAAAFLTKIVIAEQQRANKKN